MVFILVTLLSDQIGSGPHPNKKVEGRVKGRLILLLLLEVIVEVLVDTIWKDDVNGRNVVTVNERTRRYAMKTDDMVKGKCLG